MSLFFLRPFLPAIQAGIFYCQIYCGFASFKKSGLPTFFIGLILNKMDAAGLSRAGQQLASCLTLASRAHLQHKIATRENLTAVKI